jgi:glycosyltransferase involved in cell wall biosynthesis
MLAIVAPSFNQVSETFIADHVRTLAPGRTVLVCNDGRGAEVYGCPVLSHVQPPFADFGGLNAWVHYVLRRYRRRFGPALALDDRMRLVAFFRAQGVDRVLAEFGYSGVMVADVCQKLGLPLHVYFRGNDASSVMRHRSMRRRYRRMFGQVAGVFCVSEHIAREIVAIGCPPGLITVNPSGVLLDVFTPGRPEPGRILAVGRMTEKKAPHLTISAFARASRECPEATLDMVGDGPLLAQCRDMVASEGLAGRVTLHGALDHAAVAGLMRRASIFVQHSVVAPNGDTEGFPTVIAEAMATALPVVSTRHGGIPEHVRHGENGLLVEEGDVAGMAAALSSLLRDPGKARDYGAAARLHAETALDRLRSRETVRKHLFSA